MTTNENLEINEKSPLNILYAPKLKFKIPTVTPTPFSLNESRSEEESDIENEENTFDEKDIKDIKSLRNEIKTNISTLTLKIKRTINQ